MSDRQTIEAVFELINDYGVGLTGELRTEALALIAEGQAARELQRENAQLLVENARLQMELDATCNAEELRQVRADNARLRRVAQLAADAVESGAIVNIRE